MGPDHPSKLWSPWVGLWGAVGVDTRVPPVYRVRGTAHGGQRGWAPHSRGPRHQGPHLSGSPPPPQVARPRTSSPPSSSASTWRRGAGSGWSRGAGSPPPLPATPWFSTPLPAPSSSMGDTDPPPHGRGDRGAGGGPWADPGGSWARPGGLGVAVGGPCRGGSQGYPCPTSCPAPHPCPSVPSLSPMALSPCSP